MALVTWDEGYSVKSKEIDAQHKKLFDMINEYHEVGIVQKKSNEAVEKLLKGLLDYTKYHFSTEEAFMQKNNYLGYPAHKKEHDAFTQKVSDIYDRFKNGRMVLSVEISNFLKDWLLNHILQVDKKYSILFK